MINAVELFNKHCGECCDDITGRDFGLFNLLVDLDVVKRNNKGNIEDVINGADHDIIFLNIDMEKLNEVATEEDIKKLIHLGAFYNEEYGCITKFV